MRRLLAVGIAVAAVVWALPGLAQQEVIDRLQQQLRQLQEQQQRLQQEIEQLRRQQEGQRLQQEELRKKQEEAAKAPLLAGWDGGPFLRSADDRFRVALTGRMDINTAWFLADTTQKSALWVRRFRLGLEGHVFKHIGYTFEIQSDARSPSSITGDVELRFAYIDLNYFKEWGWLRFGQFTIPFSLERMTGTSRTETVERAIITQEVSPGRDIGLAVFGTDLFGVLNYGLAIFNGEGDNTSETDGGKDFATRIYLRPVREVQVGGSYRAGVHNAAGHRFRLRTSSTGFEFFRRDTRGLVESWGLEGKVEWRGAKLQSEFIRRTDERINVLSTGTRNASDVVTEGWYAQLSYFVWGDASRGGLQPVLKLERVRADNKDDVSAGFSSSDALRANFPATRAQVWHLGVNYWIGRHARFQLFWLNQQLHEAQDRNGTLLSTRENGKTNVTDNIILTRFVLLFP